MRRLIRFLLASALLLLAVSPVAAAPTRVDTLPSPAPFSKARFDFAITVLNEALGVGRGAVESANRVHLTFKTVAAPGQPEETLEVIIYDGTLYSRENDSTQWYIDAQADPGTPTGGVPVEVVGEVPDEVPITLIGDRDVAGTATDQYQLWLNADDGSFSTVDLFLGKQVAYLYKLQISAYTDIEDVLPLVGLDYRFYDFDSGDIKVYPPTNAVPRPATAAASQELLSLRSSALGLSNVIEGLSKR